MLVYFALGNAKVLSFALGYTKVPNANSFASQWNIGLIFIINGEKCSPHNPNASGCCRVLQPAHLGCAVNHISCLWY